MYSTERFVIHEHDANTAGLHYDLRISIPNRDSLASFAIPKHKIPQKEGDKVLAVKTHDHGRIWLSIDNMTIPEGQYGAGSINIFQAGVCQIEGWSYSHITFRVNGSSVKEGLDGRYALIKFRGGKSGDRDNLWVLLKTKTQ